jgi:hypothetical protein
MHKYTTNFSHIHRMHFCEGNKLSPDSLELTQGQRSYKVDFFTRSWDGDLISWYAGFLG